MIEFGPKEKKKPSGGGVSPTTVRESDRQAPKPEKGGTKPTLKKGGIVV